MKRKGVLCFLKKHDQVLLLKIDYNHTLIWNGVSGYVDLDEKTEDAVIREVHEEIGITIDPLSLKYTGTQQISSTLDLDVFIATKWEGTPKLKEKSIKEIRWFDTDDLPFEEMFSGNKDWLPSFIK